MCQRRRPGLPATQQQEGFVAGIGEGMDAFGEKGAGTRVLRPQNLTAVIATFAPSA